MMRTSYPIERVEIRLVRVPVDPPRGDAIQKFSALELPLVRLTDAAGNTGTGFSYTIGQGGTTICELLRREVAPLLLGKDSRRIGAIARLLVDSLHALTPGVVASNAFAAVDVALWDLQAKRAGLPLHVLLGGAKDSVPVYNTHVGWLDRPVDEMAELCRRAVVEQGFRAVKLKVGKPDPEEDVARVAKVREAVGPRTRIFVDANQSWTLDEAIPRLEKLARFDLGWIEEPLLATDVEGYVTLGRHTKIPRAGGESLYSPAAFHECVRRGALDILQPDIARLGGITPAMEVCALAHAANVPVAPHVSPELSVVVAAAVPNSVYVEFIPQMEPVLARKLRIESGLAHPSDVPGHGIVFDEQALGRYELAEEYEAIDGDSEGSEVTDERGAGDRGRKTGAGPRAPRRPRAA